MNLQEVNPTPVFHVTCKGCGDRLWTNRDKVFADLDGDPFRAYFCGKCAGQVSRKEMLCVCKKMMNDMIAKWTCPLHGDREPNYPALHASQLKEAMEGRR
jgi:hypothetical protein